MSHSNETCLSIYYSPLIKLFMESNTFFENDIDIS
jgi:hypothetical protein